MKKLVALAACLFLSLSTSNALTTIQEIESPQDCPKNLRITVTEDSRNSDLLKMTVSFTPDEPTPYEGRVTASCALTAKDGEKTIAKVTPKMSQNKGNEWRCSFSLNRDSFANSELGVTSMLHEKNGMATVGGGVHYTIVLKDFAPAATAVEKNAP
jgi:hypothetical protein